MDRERGESGEFVPTVTPERVLAVFETVEGPVITSGDAATELDCTPEVARQTLEQLHAARRLTHRRTAGRLISCREDYEQSRNSPSWAAPNQQEILSN